MTKSEKWFVIKTETFENSVWKKRADAVVRGIQSENDREAQSWLLADLLEGSDCVLCVYIAAADL